MKSLYARTRYRRTARLRAQSWLRRLIDYLLEAEERAQTRGQADEQNDYAFSRRLVALAFEGERDPWVSAFYYHYGRHPTKLIPEWLEREKYASSLGPSLTDLLDPALLVPDYDPTIPLRGPALCEVHRKRNATATTRCLDGIAEHRTAERVLRGRWERSGG